MYQEAFLYFSRGVEDVDELGRMTRWPGKCDRDEAERAILG